MDLKNVPTCELVDELQWREGVSFKEYGLYEPYQIDGDGPAIVLTVED